MEGGGKGEGSWQDMGPDRKRGRQGEEELEGRSEGADLKGHGGSGGSGGKGGRKQGCPLGRFTDR